MGSSFRYLRFVHVLLVTLALSARFCGTSESEENDETTSIEEDDDDTQPEITLEEFKERYRRLIPYMTFYVASNYVNNQAAPARIYAKGSPSGNAPARRPEHSAGRPINGLPNGEINYRGPLQNDDRKFVPSVQYDPRNIGGDNDFFLPVKYGSKVNYADYSNPYRPQQGQKQSYSAFTTTSGRFAQENRYYTTVRPLRPYSSHGRDQLPRKQPTKVQQTHVAVSDDYLMDYIIRPSMKTGNPNVNYPTEEFEGLRYVPAPLAKPTTIAEPALGTAGLPVIPPHRNPNVNINHILESFRLTEHLPEMLNNGNIDSSLKTLTEIFSILHGGRKEEFPQRLIPGQSYPSPAMRIPSKTIDYSDFKVPYTRPKVITETRFQATPSPLFLPEDPERFKPTAPLYDGKPKAQILPNYNGINEGKVIEYYTPYVQEIPQRSKEVLKPTARPQNLEVSTGHSYEITEDLSDDILQDERFTLPITTEAPISSQPAPDAALNDKAMPPQTSLKYGVTRGKPNVDYPAYATIPETDFSCKNQRYKGFFGDPLTGCQVWHYCDLNGGKSSFLCPNGTIFSQVALTCDWWFNVKCESTTQLYVLNERLYKYILPIMPKFPEDFTGPEVDRYLEIKFKEMEAKLKEKKLKKQQEGKQKNKDKTQKLSNHANSA